MAAFAVWNGEDAERNGLKRLSAWQTLHFEGSVENVSLGKTAMAGSAADGKRVSVMPPFEGSAAERDDLLAFLRSLR